MFRDFFVSFFFVLLLSVSRLLCVHVHVGALVLLARIVWTNSSSIKVS